jgi:integrase
MPTTRKPRAKAAARHMWFTSLSVSRAGAPATGQRVIWDDPTRGKGQQRGQAGLSLLIGASGTKSYRVTYYVSGKPKTVVLGRTDEISIAEARETARQYRAEAARGIDPRQKPAHSVESGRDCLPGQPGAPGVIYADAVAQFIELYAKPRHKSWDNTRRVLTKNATVWLDRDIRSISRSDAYTLLDGIVTSGQGAKAESTHAWLRKLWRWCFERDLVEAPIMDAVRIHVERKRRERVFSPAELVAIWQAADALDPVESAYTKLLLLLAPRKSALALMRRSDLDPDVTLWTTPFEQTKSRRSVTRRRVYLTPLPALAARILKGALGNRAGEQRVFPTLPIYQTPSGQPWFDSSGLVARLIEHGAPADFSPHAVRHTLATFLQNAGHSEYEVALVLNHSGSGSVTAGYSHGYPLELKRALLAKWADHVEQLVAPSGVALLR